MVRKIGIPAILALIICTVAVLAISSSTPKETYEYTASPDTVVFFTDLQPRPGPPIKCPHIPIPVMRIWGDGLTYINNQMYDQNATNYAGILSSDQIKDQLSLLDRYGFLKNFDLGPVNPAGTWIEMGAHLKTSSVKSSGGVDFRPQLLVLLIDRLTPFLQPIQSNTILDDRIKAAQSLWSNTCNN